MPTINGKEAGCLDAGGNPLCAFAANLSRLVPDESKPVGYCDGIRHEHVTREVPITIRGKEVRGHDGQIKTRTVPVLNEDGTPKIVDVPVRHECRACKTITEAQCVADREPVDFPAARICAKYTAR